MICLLQRDNDLVFELVGYPPGPYFFRIDSNFGDIYVNRSIFKDDLPFYTVCCYTLYICYRCFNTCVQIEKEIRIS